MHNASVKRVEKRKICISITCEKMKKKLIKTIYTFYSWQKGKNCWVKKKKKKYGEKKNLISIYSSSIWMYKTINFVVESATASVRVIVRFNLSHGT